MPFPCSVSVLDQAESSPPWCTMHRRILTSASSISSGTRSRDVQWASLPGWHDGMRSLAAHSTIAHGWRSCASQLPLAPPRFFWCRRGTWEQNRHHTLCWCQRYVDQLAQIEATTTPKLARIEQAYREIQRRDGAGECTQIWQRCPAAGGGPLGTTGYVVYLAMQARQGAALCKPVQLTEEGKMVLIGVPQDLLAYSPGSEYMDMLGNGDQAALGGG